MKDLEKQIEQASKDAFKASELFEAASPHYENGFIKGAKSEAAKAFHQQGMYSEEETEELLVEYMLYCEECERKDSFPDNARNWFETNKKK